MKNNFQSRNPRLTVAFIGFHSWLEVRCKFSTVKNLAATQMADLPACGHDVHAKCWPPAIDPSIHQTTTRPGEHTESSNDLLVRDAVD
jgi:hypothetical protein